MVVLLLTRGLTDSRFGICERRRSLAAERDAR
jgi:hypothetical protein